MGDNCIHIAYPYELAGAQKPLGSIAPTLAAAPVQQAADVSDAIAASSMPSCFAASDGSRNDL